MVEPAPAADFTVEPGSEVSVVEFHNALTGHYFMTADRGEAAGIEAGHAGPGWLRTGLQFHAFARTAPSQPACGDCGLPVYRFYAPGPNSHVFTADPQEAHILGQPGTGWLLEGEAFRIPVPDGAGRCESGSVAVVRLYNNRWMLNDSNHRYVWRDEERARLRARGWIDEDVRFCGLRAAETPLRTFALSGGVPDILPSATCEDESVHLGPCVAVNNLPPPAVGSSLPASAFFERTGIQSSFNFVQAGSAFSSQAATNAAFVQGVYPLLGLHVETSGRGASLSRASTRSTSSAPRSRPALGTSVSFPGPWRTTPGCSSWSPARST